MSMDRREFLQVLAVAAAAGMPIAARDALAATPASAKMYDVPRFGNVHLLHFTDCHAQLLPIYFREPSVNLGIGDARGQPPHLVGEHLLKHFSIARATRRKRMPSPTSTSSRRRRPTARSAASRTCRRWSSA